jgi:hypothetical protein
MPPRKPKQPARKAAPKKAIPKQDKPSFNPDTHILGDDGQVYEKKIVSGHATGAGLTNLGPKTDEHLVLERKMADAIHKAHSEGITDPDEMRARILAARTKHVEGR